MEILEGRKVIEKLQVRECTSEDIETLLKDKAPFKESERLVAAKPELLRCPLEPLKLDWSSDKYFQINAVRCEGPTCAPQSVIDLVAN